MVKVDTAPEDKVRENEADSFDPGQKHYDEEFNKITQAETDQDFDQIIDDNFGSGASDEKTDAHGDTIQRNYNSDAESASEKVKDQEENPDFMPGGDSGPKKGIGKFGKLFKKGGASGGVIGLVVAAGSITTILGAPAALLVAVERVLTNNGTHDTRANTTMARARIGAVFSAAKESVCSSKIKCKVASMSSKEIKAWKSIPGVQIEEGRTVFGRKMISSMTIDQPNGKPLKITTPGQFQDALQNNEHFRTLYARSTSSKASTFIGPDSKVKTIANKYKMKMSSPWRSLKTKVGEKKEQVSKAVNEALSKATQQAIGESGKERVTRIKNKVSSVSERLKASAGAKAVQKFGNVAGIASIGCTLYSVQKATLTAIKVSYYTDLIRFFLPFVQLANDIQSNEAIDPAVVSEIGDKYTWYQPAGVNLTPEQAEKVDLTATDSQGFQAALYGDYSKLQDFTKHYAPWYAISLATANGALKTLEDTAGPGNIHNFCVGAKYGAYLGILTGGWVGLGIYGACKVADWLASDACSDAISDGFQWIIDQGMNKVYEEVEKFNLGADLKGVDLGNALAAGIGLFLMEKSRGSGLKPATTTAAVSTFLSSTEGDYQLSVQTQKDVAKTTPFDITNQYSFISNLTSMFSQYKAEQTTGFSVLANLFSVTSSSFALATGTANAGYFQPIESVDRAESLQSMTAAGTPGGRNCQDIDMTNVGMICDWTGRSIDVLDSQVLEWGKQMQDGDVTPWNETIDYMEAGQGPEKNKEEGKGYTKKETGEPEGYSDYNSTPNPDSYEEKAYDNPYLMWKAYCTNDRVYPLGTTMLGADDDKATGENMGWFLGSKCAGNEIDGKHISAEFDTMLDRFFFYYNMCETQLGVADGNQKCWDDDSDGGVGAGAGESLKSDGEWGCPVDPNKGGIMTQKPHDIGNGTASGVDYNYGKDTPGPIYAVRDGVVTQAGPASGYGNWVMIEHEENGKKISSYYGHIANGGYFVKVGQKVKKGDHIADIGAGIVGSSTGAHVHAGLKMDPQATAQDYETRFMASCKKS